LFVFSLRLTREKEPEKTTKGFGRQESINLELTARVALPEGARGAKT